MPKVVSNDFDEIADSINGVAGRFVPTAHSGAEWSVHVVGFGDVAVQQLQVGDASTFAGDGRANGSVTIAIPLTPPSQIHVDGDPLGENSFILIREGQPFTVAARRMMRWGGVTLPIDHEVVLPGLLQPAANRSGIHTRTALRRLTQTKSLISRFCMEDFDKRMLEAAVLRAIEDEIVTTAALVLEASSKAEYGRVGRPRYSRTRIVSRTLELLEQSGDKPLFLQDLRQATQVSERTLRSVFQEQFGVSPMRLLKARQLCAIRAALLDAEPGVHQVGEIARTFGVWDLSAFARDYRALFNELPSQTLQRTALLRNRRNDTATWLGFALRWAANNPRGGRF